MYVYNINITINICIKKYISRIPLMCMNININIVRNIVIFIHIFMCIKIIHTKFKQKCEL